MAIDPKRLDYVDVTAFGKLAESYSEHLANGRQSLEQDAASSEAGRGRASPRLLLESRDTTPPPSGPGKFCRKMLFVVVRSALPKHSRNAGQFAGLAAAS